MRNHRRNDLQEAEAVRFRLNVDQGDRELRYLSPKVDGAIHHVAGEELLHECA